MSDDVVQRCAYVGCRRPSPYPYCSLVCEIKQARVVAVLAERKATPPMQQSHQGCGHRVKR